MIQFIVRRLIASIPVLLGVVIIVFILVRVIPGDPCTAMLGEKANAERCAEFNARIGLSQPIPVQLGIYLKQVFTLDLGTSTMFGRPVTDLLAQRLPTTIELTFYALLFAIVVGMSLGILSASRRNSAVDVGSMMVANLGVSIPVFVLGLVLAYLFAVVLKGTPIALPGVAAGRLSPGFRFESIAVAWGMKDLAGPPRAVLDFISNMYTINGLVTLQFGLLFDALRHMILPAVALGTIPMAIIARMTRSSLLEVMGLDYVRTARAKGLRGRVVLFRHGLRNAMLPVVTVIGLSIGGLLSGAVLTETIFGLSGVGLTITQAITSRDYAVVQGFALFVALVYVVVNLLTDISYGYLDPRVRPS
ncbi:MAG: ABC transporter permease [Chloroflexi bacterium]|nr:MAG: ABC transporter permease [Chloroflexota bacterium]